ncbi:hypothetical protein G7Y89_g3245 [Cudoniella acicularis]|uniref:Beta-lactamase-related domain-containing protein n=1 Tax=Cudoniella acicularis TaxID=354080 RepID=A0A8H4RTN0_9HELO|nr:hypothetical protein G7Y89_g3245 [Cudoniella acicularis]
MAKPITAAAMMMLWEEGKWVPEDPVSKFIPEFEGLKVRQDDDELVPQASPMTMKQLMSHSAGFGPRGEYPDQMRSDEFLEQRIFVPLGMVDSDYVLPASKAERLVSKHSYDGNGKLVAVGLSGTYNTSRPKFLGGGGGLMLSTVRDYWRFAQMILNGGEFEGKRYLEVSTVEMMHTNALEPGVRLNLYRRDINGLGFGLGYAIVQDPAAAKTSQGLQSYFWGGRYGTWFWIDPVNDMILIGFISTINSSTPAVVPVHELSARSVYRAMGESSRTAAENLD